MNILAIDPGTHCGYARSVPESGVWDLSTRRHEGGGMRFVRLRQHLVAISDGLDMIVYEEVRGHKGVDAAQIYGGIIAVIQEHCETRNIPYTGIPVGTIKKWATGKGNANKQAMIEAAQVHYPSIEIKDDNHADALMIWGYAQETFGGQNENS